MLWLTKNVFGDFCYDYTHKFVSGFISASDCTLPKKVPKRQNRGFYLFHFPIAVVALALRQGLLNHRTLRQTTEGKGQIEGLCVGASWLLG